MTTIDEIKKVIEKLKVSQTRVPYTYHHDFVRSSIESVYMSRSDIGKIIDEKNIQNLDIYCTCLMEILKNKNPITIMKQLNDSDMKICISASVVCTDYMKRVYNIDVNF